eukprot:scaffold192278_cov21-Tisochrysis_lutea.AAC.1
MAHSGLKRFQKCPCLRSRASSLLFYAEVALLVWGDERISLVQQGVTVWVRDESLAGVQGTTMRMRDESLAGVWVGCWLRCCCVQAQGRVFCSMLQALAAPWSLSEGLPVQQGQHSALCALLVHRFLPAKLAVQRATCLKKGSIILAVPRSSLFTELPASKDTAVDAPPPGSPEARQDFAQFVQMQILSAK